MLTVLIAALAHRSIPWGVERTTQSTSIFSVLDAVHRDCIIASLFPLSHPIPLSPVTTNIESFLPVFIKDQFRDTHLRPVMSLVEEWWKSVPPVTRSYICLSVLTTGAVALEIITPYKLYLDWKLVMHRAHVWRVFTNFLFFGNFSLDFLFHMFFLYRYCKMLETNSFRGRTADFLYMLIFGATLLVLVSPLTSIDFLGPSLTFMMVYVWGRRNSRQAVGFLGVLNFRAPYLPWVLLIFSFVLGSSPSMDMLGIFAGHVYYYMADVYPAMAGVTLLKTPRILQILFGNNDEYDNPYDDIPPDPRQNQQNNGVAGWGQGRMLDGGGRQ